MVGARQPESTALLDVPMHLNKKVCPSVRLLGRWSVHDALSKTRSSRIVCPKFSVPCPFLETLTLTTRDHG